MSYLIGLVCSFCDFTHPATEVQTICKNCQSPLFAHYDFDSIRRDTNRQEFNHRPGGLWRWKELLPLGDETYRTSLGEGDTPLLRLTSLGRRFGFSNLFLKEEGQNPTGSFKARGAAVALSKARELGISDFIIPSAGNAGSALSTYAARAGCPATIVMPKDTPEAILMECKCAGSEVILIDGLISDCGRIAQELADREGWFSMATFKEPYRLEGKKTMGLELAESFGWRLPDVVLFPTGGGTGIVGLWKAFQELDHLGWLEDSSMPRMVAVQASGCAPIVEAFRAGMDRSAFWPGAHTIAAGLRVPQCYADKNILGVLRESKGEAIAVDDGVILEAQQLLAKEEGVFGSPEGAATLAGLIQLVQTGKVSRSDRIVIFNTATGVKYTGIHL